MSRLLNKEIKLVDGSNIAVIGGGPSGSFFTYYALEFASRLDLNITIDIYEAKNFTKIGAGGCNHCGGIISESLVQKLSTDGIIIPTEKNKVNAIMLVTSLNSLLPLIFSFFCANMTPVFFFLYKNSFYQ